MATPFEELMNRDPLSLTSQDLDMIVKGLREQRSKFVLGDKKVGTPAARKSPATKKGEAALSLLEGLNLDLKL